MNVHNAYWYLKTFQKNYQLCYIFKFMCDVEKKHVTSHDLSN